MSSLRSSRTLRQFAAISWIVLIAVAFLAPALSHGTSIGPYDLLSRSGLTANPHVNVHNLVGSDEIQEFIPWEALAWLQVHAGHLPLWDPYSMLGMPLAFNVQSAPFSLTVAIGYLFPLALAHTATVAARLVIAGSGAYVFARVMRLDILPALMSATIFELSGAFTIWLGAYEADAMAWLGWILAASVLVLRGRHRVGSICLLAITLAFGFLAGEPQIAAVEVGVLALFALIMIFYQWHSGDHHKARSAGLDHLLGLLAGAALAAPVYLPGIQLGLSSARNAGPPVSGLPLYDLTHLLFSDYNGLPTSLSTVIGPDNLYVSMLYVGTIALVLSMVAFALWRERREVVALTATGLVLLVLLFASPLLSLFRHVAYLDVFRLQLATTAVDFCLAALAGFGAQALMTKRGQRNVELWYRVGIAVVGCSLLVLGLLLALNVSHLPGPKLSVRAGSFVWPGAGLGACAVVWLATRRAVAIREHSTRRAATQKNRLRNGPLAGLCLLLFVETAFLLTAGAGFLSSDQGYLPRNKAVTSFQRLVGTSLVGFGSCGENSFPTTGLLTNVNVAYQIDELAAYDPILPRSYYASYGEATGGTTNVLLPVGLFCPAINSVRLARLFGVSYIIEPPGSAGPVGTRRVAVLNGESVYQVPNSGWATLVPFNSSGPVAVEGSSEPTPGSWRIKVDSPRPSRLELRITNVPGWQAEIDGRPLRLVSLDKIMLEAKVPKGQYVVTLRYWPKALSFGLVLACAAVLILVSAEVTAVVRRRRIRSNGAQAAASW